uniref:Uncharacterized protein n=1 Tax=Rhodnius prolixus TaxID=13249 RepID=T1I1T6_RHOPR
MSVKSVVLRLITVIKGFSPPAVAMKKLTLSTTEQQADHLLWRPNDSGR